MDPIAILVGIGVFVVVVLVAAVVVRIVVMRPAISAAFKEQRQVTRDREVFQKAYEFTMSTSAERVLDAVQQRWSRAVPSGEPGFYVGSVIEGQQVILLYGNRSTPRIFTARIDFESRDPASGTLWFYDAEVLSPGTEAAEQLRADFAHIIAELSPGSVLQERQEPVITASWKPDENSRYQPRKRHRRK